jgi:hypothetical protein
MRDRGVALILMQFGKRLHQNLLDQVLLIVPPGKVGADNPGNNREEMPDEFFRGGFIAFFPAPQTGVDIDSFIHLPSSLAIGGVMQ